MNKAAILGEMFENDYWKFIIDLIKHKLGEFKLFSYSKFAQLVPLNHVMSMFCSEKSSEINCLSVQFVSKNAVSRSIVQKFSFFIPKKFYSSTNNNFFGI